MAGDVIQIPAAGAFMIHDPAMGVYGYYRAEEFIKLAEELQVIKNCIINAYILKTGKNKEEISAIMEAETWYDGKTAVEHGFCDELMFEEIQTDIENSGKVIVNSVLMDISNFQNIPNSLLDDKVITKENVYILNNEREELYNMEINTVDELKAVYPDLTKQITDDATMKERKRIKDIEEISLKGFENIVQDAKFENPITASDVSMKIVAQMKIQGQQFLNNRNEDIKNSGVMGVGNESNNGRNGEQINPYDAAIEKVFSKDK